MKKSLQILLAIAILLLAPDYRSLFAVDQMRTIETYVGDDNTALTNTTINKDFTIYIGNNISGITNPVKSVYFVVTGVYTSSAVATLDLKIDSDAATLQQFSLPSTSATPTPFEVLYKDPSNKINPTSAGSYSFQLNIIVPSAITIYGLGAKVMTTYRYAPVSCDDGQPTAEKIKTAESYAYDSASSFSSAVSPSPTFTIYIGDNLSGVGSPAVKSFFIKVSGVYTGSGSLTLTLDSGNSQAFTLPSVGTTPTPFELLYKDTSSIVNPTSAGTYTYTFGISPSGVTLYAFGATAYTTYRYKPPTCGGGLPVSGELTSAVFDTAVTDGAAYNAINWKGTLVSGTKVRFQLATSNCSNAATNPPTCSPAGTWSTLFLGGATCGSGDWYDASNTDKSVETTCSGHNNNRYYRYKVQLCSGDCSTAGTVTSTVTDVNVSWSP